METDELLARINRLKKWMLGIGLLAIALLVAVTAIGLSMFRDEIQARRFVLVDEHGIERGVFGIMEHTVGELPPLEIVGVVLFDKTGTKRASLENTSGGSFLSLFDESGNICSSFRYTRAGHGVVLWDEYGKTRGDFLTGRDGTHMSLRDERGEVRGMFWADQKMTGITTWDENKKLLFSTPTE